MVDTVNGTKQKYVHHATALTACKIIANNAVNGYLALDREGRNQVAREDDVLTEREYWFFAGNPGDQPYPVVPSFRD
ncbi:hypothetical protein F4825DRAFT_403270 [Nemania diffusa]|nr:hypothetical protein F4825DRAFT_403270 [Nemania diffusa]